MPVLEPDVRYVPQYQMLGYTSDELYFVGQ